MFDDDAADTLGLDGVWYDPLWRVHVALTPLEQELLRTWEVRRLALIAHAGAASLTTTQNYSRLEHSLGVLALVTHFEPGNTAARATALLHDVGHLPFSHSAEGLHGLDHHTIGARLIAGLGDLLRAHGTSPDEVIALDAGTVPSPLVGRPGGLKLDHLDSFLRSGQANGRTREVPSEMLRRIRLVDGTVDTDAETAAALTDLVVAEAVAHRSDSNVIAVAVVRDLVATLLEHRDPAEVAAMTDDEAWGALLADPATRDTARAFRRDPAAWTVRPPGTVPGEGDVVRVVRRSYLDLPTVDGVRVPNAVIDELQSSLPLSIVVSRA